MRNHKTVFIFSNPSPMSKKTHKVLKQKLTKSGFVVLDEFCKKADLIVVIGGDGTLLSAATSLDFPEVPIVGINTGHLGFFQELLPNQLDDLIHHFSTGRYYMQTLKAVKIDIHLHDGTLFTHYGLNEICIKGDNTHPVHLDISINNGFIERFNGDGILIATSTGSTAYCYSLGGSIVDPRIDLLQLVPIAPMNTTAYRSFTSSIMLPSDMTIGVIPDFSAGLRVIQIVYDGFSAKYDDVASMDVSMGEKKINLIRFEEYNFWRKVKDKFL